ncbi:MAG: LysR family transcriptional regulator [Paracoccaceae bacterium]
MRYTLRQLTYFVAASDHGSISNATRVLNVSQPSISNAIIQLEKQYSVSLFLRRNSSGVRLTPSGELLLREARSILAHANDFEALATSVVNEVTGDIRVACFVNIAPVYMASVTRLFQEKYPNTHVDMMIGNQQEVFDAIDSGRYELGLTFDLDLPQDYRIDYFASFPPQLILPVGHRFAGKPAVPLKEMQQEPFVYLDLPHSSSYFFSLFTSQGLQVQRTVPVASFETIRSFVGNELGFSILNLMPKNQRNYDGTRVQYVPIEGAHRPLNLCAISLKRNIYRRSTLAFIDHLKDFFSKA